MTPLLTALIIGAILCAALYRLARRGEQRFWRFIDMTCEANAKRDNHYQLSGRRGLDPVNDWD